MTDNAIRKALDNRLNAIASGIDVAWPNTGYKPTTSPYIRPTFLPSDVSQAELGTLGRNVHIGLYQVDAIYPAGEGRKAAETRADAVIEQFKRGTTFTYSGVTVRCDAARTLPATSEKDWYTLPVQIDYRAYLDN